MSPPAKSYYTPEEYLAFEREAEYKNEYVNGKILPMASANRWHNAITVNLTYAIGVQLRGRPYEVYASAMRIKVSATGAYLYPDLVAVREKARLEDAHRDTLLNPTVIIEVLSPSMEAYDRGEKFAHYRRLESLTNYVMVLQDKVRVEHYVRSVNTGNVYDHWVLSELNELDGPYGTLQLASIDCAVPLRDIYERVEFPTEDSESASVRRPREGWDEKFAEMAKRGDDKPLHMEQHHFSSSVFSLPNQSHIPSNTTFKQ
jgi:Uma2 family endonuclease